MSDKHNEITKREATPVDRLKRIIGSDSVKEQFKNALAENSGLFVASLIDVYANDSYLQRCEPKDVVMEALKAATLKLPLNKNLGFAYIVPFKNKATMQIGYKGYLQLAQRTGQYRFINADCVYEGEEITVDRLTGEVYFSGEQTSETAIGYFAHIETTTGFRKTIFWTRARVEAHAQRYSQSYQSGKNSPWKTHFDEMAIKTVLRSLLSKYGVMSVEMASAIHQDYADTNSFDNAQNEVDDMANKGNVIDIDPKKEDSKPDPDPEPTEEQPPY